MITKDNILKLKTRRLIYDLILKNPGLHQREILRRTKLSSGVLSYHLNFLKKQELIITRVNRRYTRYYIKDTVGKNEKEILNVLRQKIPLRIVLILLTPGPGDIYKNKETQITALKNLATHTHLKIYSKKELVGLTMYWDGPYSKLLKLSKHRTTIDFHLNKLFNIGIIEKIPIGKEIKYKLKNENLIWRFLIKYKKVLSDESINRSLIWAEDKVDNIIDPLMEIIFDIFPHPYHA